jgi:predicted Zn-dependent peptidase
MLLVMMMRAETAVQKQEFTTSKGLNVKFLIDNTMNFIHAELLIYYNGKYKNPAIPSLTLLNIFNKDVNKSGSNLLSILKKMGNDFEVNQTVDFQMVKINFLPDRLQQFIKFLKNLYSYRSFLNIKINPDSHIYRKRQRDILKKFNDSVKNYWQYFFKKEDWKRDIAYQIAYNKLFPGNPLGNTLITSDAIKQVSMSDIRTFYQRTYRLPNSLLIIKGKFKPQLARAYINSEFASFKRQVPEVPVSHKLRINNKREIVIFNINNSAPPLLFWFDASVPVNHKNYIPFLALNNILFGFPTGRIYLGAREMNMSGLEIHSEVTNHKEVSVICNTVELRSRDIETFIRLVDREKKKLTKKRVERKEYLNTLSYFYGKTKVDTQHIDNDINREILTTFFPFEQKDFIRPAAPASQVTLAALNEHLVDSRNNEDTPNGVIVIIGNYNSIRRYLKTIKHVVFNY